MSEPFLGEIRTFAFDFAPRGWALCNGQLLSIAQHQALYSLLGNTYGGDGRTTFALPNLQGRTPVHPSEGIAWGEAAGEEGHALSAAEMPPHTHSVRASTASDQKSPGGNYWGPFPQPGYSKAAPDGQMDSACIGSTGGNQPHPNMQPYTVLNFCIAVQGIYPSRN